MYVKKTIPFVDVKDRGEVICRKQQEALLSFSCHAHPSFFYEKKKMQIA